MESRDVTKIEGTIESVTFRNEDNGFTVLTLECGGEPVTVVGEFVDAEIGEGLIAHGSYMSHPTYGMQFRASAYEKILPATSGAILKYLGTGAVKGVGKAIAAKMVDAFGDDTLEIMENQPERLIEVKGVSPKKAAEIAQGFKKLFGVRSVMSFLSKYDIGAACSIKVWKLWGADAAEIIKVNPYMLCQEEIGIEFDTADGIADELGLPMDAKARISAGVEYILRHNSQNGHTCLPYGRLLETAAGMLKTDDFLIEDVIEECEGKTLVTQVFGKTRFIYLSQLYNAENYIASRIKMMLSKEPPKSLSCGKEIDKLEASLGIKYAQKQRDGIQEALINKLFILTGGPGTGKTTTLNAIISLLEQRGLKIGLAAPTGRAAKRMSELTGREAKTIHRLLEVDFTDGMTKHGFKRNARNPLPLDAIIIDEMSMVDVLLFESLIKALKLNCKLILVGDADQLPSVGPGNVLGDLIASDVICTIKLTEIFRQAASSLIVTNAHTIVRGNLPDMSAKDSDFFFLHRPDYDISAKTVADLCETRLPKSYGFSPFEDIQIIAPSKKGRLGTYELNRLLQDTLNPKSDQKDEFKIGSVIFREGDKVMQTKNNYDIIWNSTSNEQGMGIYNGDIGIIEMIDRPSRSMIIRFDDRIAEYNFDMAVEIEHAYAITVHKSQGSEFESVIIPLMNSHPYLYYRNLLYTAVTRAKKLLIILGTKNAVYQMVNNNKKNLRYTNLKAMLT